MNLHKYYLIFFSLFHYLIINSADSKCQESFECGKLGSLEFPLSHINNSGCGLFMVDDCDSENPKIQLGAGGLWYDILHKVSTNKFFIRDPVLQKHLNDKSCFSFTNVSLPKSPFSSFTVSPNLTLITCCNQPHEKEFLYHFEIFRPKNCPLTVYYKKLTTGVPAPGEISIPPECSMIQVPMNSSQGQDSSELFSLLSAEFYLEWNVSEACNKLHHEGGQCLSNTVNEFYCKKGIIMLTAG